MAIVVNINGGKDFEPLSEGIHTLCLADIVDLGIEQTPFGSKPKIRFVYLSDEADEDGRTKYVFEKFTASLHEKATLRGRVRDLLGRDLTEEELAAGKFDVETLIGVQKKAVIEHNESKGKIYANVKAIIKGKATGVVIPDDFVRAKDKAPKTNGAAKPMPPARSAVGGGTAVAKAILAPASQGPISDEDIPF